MGKSEREVILFFVGGGKPTTLEASSAHPPSAWGKKRKGVSRMPLSFFSKKVNDRPACRCK
jgi:hypothetical protein